MSPCSLSNAVRRYVRNLEAHDFSGWMDVISWVARADDYKRGPVLRAFKELYQPDSSKGARKIPVHVARRMVVIFPETFRLLPDEMRSDREMCEFAGRLRLANCFQFGDVPRECPKLALDLLVHKVQLGPCCDEHVRAAVKSCLPHMCCRRDFLVKLAATKFVPAVTSSNSVEVWPSFEIIPRALPTFDTRYRASANGAMGMCPSDSPRRSCRRRDHVAAAAAPWH